MRHMLSILGILISVSLAFADPEGEALAMKKCHIDVKTIQSVLQTAFVNGKMDVGSASLFGTLGSKCMALVGEERYHKKNGKDPKVEMQKIYSKWGDRALSILWDVSRASLAWVKWGAGVERDPIQNEKYVLCLISDEVTNAVGFLDETQETKMQRTLVGFPGGVPKYVPMSKKMCAETSGEMLKDYQSYFNYRANMLNLGQTPKEIY